MSHCGCLKSLMNSHHADAWSWCRQAIDKCFHRQVGSIVNLSLMYLLAPTASSAAGKSAGLIQKLFSAQLLQAWGAPTGHMFERGYPFASRVVNLGYKVACCPQKPVCLRLLAAS